MRVNDLRLHQTTLLLEQKEIGGGGAEGTTETGIDMSAAKADNAQVFVGPWNRRIMEGKIVGSNKVIMDGRLKYIPVIHQDLFEALREILVIK